MSKDNYNIVLYKTDAEADRLVINTLQQHYLHITVVEKLTDVCEQLLDKTTKVFFNYRRFNGTMPGHLLSQS
ncbi:MAG: hypothetical protein ACJA13_002655 [Paraglaciecola sp.]|jgi:hypothetical protein